MELAKVLSRNEKNPFTILPFMYNKACMPGIAKQCLEVLTWS